MRSRSFYKIMISDFSKLDLPNNRPAFIFVSGPQGVGKTKICADLAESFQSQAKKVVVISLDDFYLTFEEQTALAAKGNPLLRYRGLPGTHDIVLAQKILEKLASGASVLIPRYDKSLNQGRGDRVPISQWQSISGLIDRVIFEGWCLGFKHLPLDYPFEDYGGYNAENIRQVNENLMELEKLYEFADAFLHYKAKDIGYVVEWRWDQELALKKQHGLDSGLSHGEVKDFVSRFMPIYHYYLPGLDSGFFTEKVKMSLQFSVDHNRNVVRQKLCKPEQV